MGKLRSMWSQQKIKDSTSLPLIMAPMFLISNPDMVIEACKKGVVGSFPALNQRTSAGFEDWLNEIEDALADFETQNPGEKAAPYAVNLIVSPENPRLQDDLDIIVKHKVPIVITSLGVDPRVIQAVQSYGGMVLHDVTNKRHAKRAAKEGVDGIIAVAAGAGGHGGVMNPVALVGEIREFFDGMIALAGTLSHGKDVLAAEVIGADFAYMGTRFINTQESDADDKYKDMITASEAADIVYTSAVSGVPANFLRESLKRAGFDDEKLEKLGGKSPKLKSVKDEMTAWKTIWSAGQGVGSVKDVPSMSELIERLISEYETAQDDVAQAVKSRGAGRKPQP